MKRYLSNSLFVAAAFVTFTLALGGVALAGSLVLHFHNYGDVFEGDQAAGRSG